MTAKHHFYAGIVKCEPILTQLKLFWGKLWDKKIFGGTCGIACAVFVVTYNLIFFFFLNTKT